MTYMATPQHKTPAPGIKQFTILVDLSLAIMITIHLVWLNHVPEKKYMNFTFFTPKLTAIGRGAWNLQFLSPYPTDATYEIW